MSDVLGITASWSPKRNQNVFGVRGVGQRYENLYRWLNGKKCSARSVSNDWPWDYIVFDDPFHEQQFMTIYQGDIIHDEDPEYAYRPLQPGLKPKGWVPHEERVEGQSYREACGHYHVWTKPTGRSLEDEIADVLSAEIAKEIDNEVLRELIAFQETEVPVEPENIPGIWAQLKDLEPYDSGSSLHVWEARYSLHGVRYAVYWEIGGSDVPFEIAVLK